MHEP
ncbi:hypothetical protein VCHC50A2_3665, partial [Vibrio cholerae HC-50A2]|jgi:hypothetical protein